MRQETVRCRLHPAFSLAHVAAVVAAFGAASGVTSFRHKHRKQRLSTKVHANHEGMPVSGCASSDGYSFFVLLPVIASLALNHRSSVTIRKWGISRVNWFFDCIFCSSFLSGTPFFFLDCYTKSLYPAVYCSAN